ncbi:hypothetical protein F4821DRAFT_253181 [Hypoxylon rubiginosum]|uniref:Uncharacterized protein n=1 Tax=Hypoxylon rubiginosum TaxID=110542 RepID=A0ACC0DKU4_9PEZI|nr:hypothetical protein F4821DRAFT_253181 [Hypoxylon rubiginosum]
MAAQGANITIFGRKQDLFDEARTEILAARQVQSQVINAVAGDMSIASSPQLPDVLCCVAGGTPAECGFLVDLEPEIFKRCMTNNYYSSLYPAQAVLKRWIQDDANAEIPPSPKLRKIIFVNSSVSLVLAPGYLAYSSTVPWQTRCGSKSRDTRARSPPTYAVQCIFAHNYITQTFLEEQKMKPDLCKRIEGMTATDVTTLEKHFPHVAKIAPEIVAAVASNDFAITDKRLEPQFLWAGGIGSSPKRGWGVVDSLLALLASLLFPLIRRDIEKKCQGDAFRSE